MKHPKLDSHLLAAVSAAEGVGGKLKAAEAAPLDCHTWLLVAMMAAAVTIATAVTVASAMVAFTFCMAQAQAEPNRVRGTPEKGPLTIGMDDQREA